MWNFFGSLSALTVVFLCVNQFCALLKVNASSLKEVNLLIVQLVVLMYQVISNLTPDFSNYLIFQSIFRFLGSF